MYSILNTLLLVIAAYTIYIIALFNQSTHDVRVQKLTIT